jgi:cytochrome c oxidase subunit II
MQNIVLIISATFMLTLVGLFIWIIANSNKDAPFETIVKPAYRARFYLFVLVLIVGIVVTELTLAPWPYDADKDKVTRQVDVQAQQWLWTLSDDKAKVGEVIEFVLTSKDVNHGFALYSPDKKIVAQMQVMPTFTNKVRYAFKQPGIYKILCMEYCGLAHHGMAAEITVTQ